MAHIPLGIYVIAISSLPFPGAMCPCFISVDFMDLTWLLHLVFALSIAGPPKYSGCETYQGMAAGTKTILYNKVFWKPKMAQNIISFRPKACSFCQ